MFDLFFPYDENTAFLEDEGVVGLWDNRSGLNDILSLGLNFKSSSDVFLNIYT